MRGTSSCLLLPTMLFIMKESFSLISFAFELSFDSRISTFLFYDSRSFFIDWLAISKSILLFFYYDFLIFFNSSISECKFYFSILSTSMSCFKL